MMEFGLAVSLLMLNQRWKKIDGRGLVFEPASLTQLTSAEPNAPFNLKPVRSARS